MDDLKQQLVSLLSQREKNEIAISTTLADIACLLQASRKVPAPVGNELDESYGNMVVDLLESGQVPMLSLGSAFFVLGKCYNERAFDRFLEYLVHQFEFISDLHATGNASIAMENHTGLIKKGSRSHSIALQLLEKIESAPVSSAWHDMMPRYFRFRK